MLTLEDKEAIRKIFTEIVDESGTRVGAIVDVTARAMEVLGTREKALRWLKTPVRILGNRTPLSLLSEPEGIGKVLDALGQIEHGVW
ncbi:MAG TPA: MbcA/ParS/Xre antitoxin family protein [Bryobacteraceae bacterium]|jgi:putative toxin-antitoxin system antitoxin component (TIGR02293 family)